MKYLKFFDSFQPIYAYRGERINHNPPNGPAGHYFGTYFYIGDEAKENAKKLGENIIVADITNANLYILDTPEKLKQEARKAGYDVREASGYIECNYLKSMGYDGIKIGSEVVLFDKNKFLI